jgi:Asp-tRNA(Asn)/Glu-tRNA(Gln) amidotransferase C subunit
MSNSFCSRCCAILREAQRTPNRPAIYSRAYSAPTKRVESDSLQESLDIETLLSQPTWSVRSLLPDPSIRVDKEISPKRLHHLLRLSALPQPKSSEEESEMLKTLHSQLKFVRDTQSVNTDGVEPLQSIMDETESGIDEITIGKEQLKEAFAEEEVKGRNRRPRRVEAAVDKNDAENWDILGTAGRTVDTPGGRFFVVKSSKE